MAITVRSTQQLISNSVQAAWTLGGTTAVGDLAVLIHGNDYYTAANLTSPGGTAVASWALNYTFDGGSWAGHVKVWTGLVTTGGASTVTTTSTSTDEERAMGVFILYDSGGGTVSYDTALAQAVASATSSDAPSVTPTNADDLLICLWMIGGGGGQDTTYTPPGTMTAYTNLNIGGGGSARFASQLLSSGAATGTRTATLSPAQPTTTASALLKTSATPSGLLPQQLQHRSPEGPLSTAWPGNATFGR